VAQKRHGLLKQQGPAIHAMPMPSNKRSRALLAHRDGNGDPIPDSPRGIPLLGDGDGEVSSPTGM
jgi:hypothetical protein